MSWRWAKRRWVIEHREGRCCQTHGAVKRGGLAAREIEWRSVVVELGVAPDHALCTWRVRASVYQSHQRSMAMSDSPNVSVVRRLYQARGNPEVMRQVLGSEVRWEVVDGFPYGAVYEGLDSVLHDFFGRLFTDFDEFVANGSEFFESGEHVIALGSYAGRARRTGKRFTARFAHVWTLQDGLIVRLQQCADTVQLARALADEHETTA